MANPLDVDWLHSQIKDNVVFYGKFELGHQGFLIAKDMSYFTKVINMIKDLSSGSKSIDVGEGIKKDILKEGTGPLAKEGTTVKVHYTGKLLDGTVFDSSVS